MKGRIEATKGCIKFSTIKILFDDGWFSALKQRNIPTHREHITIGLFKNHKSFWVYLLGIMIKNHAVFPYLIMKSMSRVSIYIPVMDIGNKYNSKNVPRFIDTNGSVSNV